MYIQKVRYVPFTNYRKNGEYIGNCAKKNTPALELLSMGRCIMWQYIIAHWRKIIF